MSDNDELLFNRLEEVNSDPVVERVFQSVREYQILISETENITKEELEQIVGDLDSRWPYLHDEVVFTGKAVLPNQVTDDIEQVMLHDEHILSRGFYIVNEPIVIEDEVVSSVYKIVHGIAYIDHKTGTQLNGHIDIDEGIIDYPFQSLEAIRNSLEYHDMEVVNDIDELVYSAANEDEAIYNLREAVLSDELGRLPVNELCEYLNCILDFDTQIPYVINTPGPIWVQGETDLVAAKFVKPEELLVSSLHMAAMPAEDEDGVSCFVLALSCLHTGPDSNEKTNIVVPLRHLLSISSLRRLVYEVSV